MELDKILNIYCYSEFHASCEAIIRQLPKVTVTIKDIGKTEHVARDVWCVARLAANKVLLTTRQICDKN